ncbi:hypothetical protein MCEMSHM24_00539 [Comamonadaceae bacterium]
MAMPVATPSVTVGAPALYTELSYFMPRHSICAAPTSDSDIPLETRAVARFLVRVKPFERRRREKSRQKFWRICSHHVEFQAYRSKFGPEIAQTLDHKPVMLG